MSNFRAVLFDFDGTFVDSGLGILNCVEYALEKHNIPIGDRSRLNYFIGPPLYVSFNHLYGVQGEECDKLVETYRERYNTKGVHEFEVYDGIEKLIKKLKEQGIKVGIASAKPRVYIEQMLNESGNYNLFDVIVGTVLSNHNEDKAITIENALKELEITDKSICVMVGDRHYDITAAKKSGVASVGVTYGYGTEEELENAGADYIAHNMTELHNILLNKA